MPDIPLAYLITFRCYGTWLHGDERGSIDRRRNQHNSDYIMPNPNWHEYNIRHLKRFPVTLTDLQRQSVEAAIRETCRFRNWELRAINVRTNHVHTLVSTGALKPERALNALKANATRQLRQDGQWPHEHTPWADGGSRRYVWTELGIERATEYVINGQDGQIPELDPPRTPRPGHRNDLRRRNLTHPSATADGTDPVLGQAAARRLRPLPLRLYTGASSNLVFMNWFRWLFSGLQASFAGETAGRVHAFFPGYTVSAAGGSSRGTGFMRS